MKFKIEITAELVDDKAPLSPEAIAQHTLGSVKNFGCKVTSATFTTDPDEPQEVKKEMENLDA